METIKSLLKDRKLEELSYNDWNNIVEYCEQKAENLKEVGGIAYKIRSIKSQRQSNLNEVENDQLKDSYEKLKELLGI